MSYMLRWGVVGSWLVINPTVLLLDEPFSALDKNLRASMQVELREIQRKLEVTTIFVTHDQGEALSLSDRLAVMSEGRIRQLGTPEEIYRRPCDRFVASFVGDANVLRGRLDGLDGTHAVVAVGVARVNVPASPAPSAARSLRRSTRAGTSISTSTAPNRCATGCWCDRRDMMR